MPCILVIRVDITHIFLLLTYGTEIALFYELFLIKKLVLTQRKKFHKIARHGLESGDYDSINHYAYLPVEINLNKVPSVSI